jgi:hypothetical protein
MSGWLSVVSFVLGIALSMMATILAVQAAKSSKIVQFDSVWDTFKKTWWKLILLVIAIGVLVVAGLILLIWPGLYIGSRLALAPYLLIDQNKGITESMNASWALTKGRAWPVFTAIFFGLILSLPSIVPVIGSIVALVLGIAYSCALPLRYYEYKATANAAKKT